MACCRCNRTGFCKGCACVKAKKSCVNCLPGKLGNCANRSTATVMGSTNSHPEPLRDSNTTIATAATAATTATTTTSSGDEPPLCQPLEPDPPCPRLPDHPSVSVPAFTWGNLSGPDFAMTLDATYAEVVHWRRNCFTVPYGKGGKEFVRELSRLFLAFGSASALEAVTLKAATVFPILLLQKPSSASKTKNHITCLERRLACWSKGDLDELVREGRAIQQRLPKQRSAKANTSLSRSFASLMFRGKCKAALDLLTREEKGGILHLDEPAGPGKTNTPTVREILTSKHPPGQPADSKCIISCEPQESHPVIFESLDGNAIRSAALRVMGAAGPSGLDSHQWRRLCTSHKGTSWDLCASLASVARRICSSYVHPTSIAPLLACRLIALDKHPGVRPIGIGDTARRIIAKPF